jgi:hypothetical protein
MAAPRWIYQNIPGPLNLHIATNTDGTYNQPLPSPPRDFIQASQPYDTAFIAQSDGVLESMTLAHAINRLAPSSTLTLTLSDERDPTPTQVLATGSLTSDFAAGEDPRGDAHTLTLDTPVPLKRNSIYFLRLEIDQGALEVAGATIANETDYDYPLPFRMDNYDAFGGIYRGDLTCRCTGTMASMQRCRFVTFLNDIDYILIPTNHQYARSHACRALPADHIVLP